MSIREVDIDLFQQRAFESGLKNQVVLKNILATKVEKGNRDGELYTMILGYKKLPIALTFYKKGYQDLDIRKAIRKTKEEIESYNIVSVSCKIEDQIDYACTVAKRIHQIPLSNMNAFLSGSLNKKVFRMAQDYVDSKGENYTFEGLYLHCIDNITKECLGE